MADISVLGLAGRIGCLNLLIIGAALFAGLWLDDHFGTRPFITLVLVVVSMPVALIAVIRLALSIVKQLQHPEIHQTVTPEENEVDRTREPNSRHT